MATRNNRNQNRGGGGGGNQGGGGDNKIAITAGISGKRNDCKVNVQLRRGRFALPNETLMFRLGTVDFPHGPWIMDAANPTNRYMISTNADGEAMSIAFDFTGDDHKNFTQVLVVYFRNNPPSEGIYEQAVQLPVFDATEAAKLTKKSKRLQFKAPDETLKSDNNRFSLPLIRTLNKDGKTSSESLIFTATTLVTLINKQTGRPLSFNGKTARRVKYFEYTTPASGLAMLEVSFDGLECEFTITHTDSGEQASVKLEFDY